MKEILNDLLWIGNAMDIRDPTELFEAGIAAIVDVAYEEKPAALPRQLVYCRFPLIDGAGNEGVIINHAIQTTLRLIRSDVKTIVACSVGASRSPTIAAFAIAAFSNQDPAKVISSIADRFALDVNPTFWNEVANSILQDRDERVDVK